MNTIRNMNIDNTDHEHGRLTLANMDAKTTIKEVVITGAVRPRNKKMNTAEKIEHLAQTVSSLNAMIQELVESHAANDESLTPSNDDGVVELDLPKLQTKMAMLSKSGHFNKVKATMNKYGANKLKDITPVNFEPIAKEINLALEEAANDP